MNCLEKFVRLICVILVIILILAILKWAIGIFGLNIGVLLFIYILAALYTIKLGGIKRI